MDSNDRDRVMNEIVEATVEYLSKFGVQNATSRELAKSAGVNPALINYYFASKEALIGKAISTSLEKYFDELLEKVKASSQPGYSLLRLFLEASLRDAIDSPNIIRSYMHDALLNGDCSGMFFVKIAEFLNRNLDLLRGASDFDSRDTIKVELVQMLSSVLFIGLFPGFFRDFLDVDFLLPENQEGYISKLMNKYRAD